MPASYVFPVVPTPQNRPGHPTSSLYFPPRVSSPLNWTPEREGRSVIQLATIRCFSSFDGCLGMLAVFGKANSSPRLSVPSSDNLGDEFRSEEHTSELQSLAFLVCALR